MFSGRTVFVTGAAGFLGPWLCEALLERGANVIALVRDLAAESRFPRERVTVVQGELEDFELLQRVLYRYEVGSVFHLGAQALVGVAYRDPFSTFESNVRGTYNLLEACRRAGTPQIVMASSDKAYGQAEGHYTEESRLDGVFPYDVSKSCADLIARSYFRTYGTPVTVTRCGNFFGGGDLHWSRLVPGTVRWALRGERPVIRSNGKYVRDYLYIEDAAAAYLHLAEAQLKDPSLAGEAFNFSFEQPWTVLELTRKVLELVGRPDLEPEVQDLPETRFEIQTQMLNAAKARERLGWAPRFGLEEGLRRTIDWYRDYLKLSR